MGRRGIYVDERQVFELTRTLMSMGHTIFQGHLLGKDEAEHCVTLRSLLPVADGTSILDIGSGVGGIPDHLRQFKWTLLNISEVQLKLSNPDHVRVCGDMERLPFKSNRFDAAIICYCLGHASNISKVLREALRVAKIVLVHDIAAEDPRPWQHTLQYTPLNLEKLIPQWGRPRYILEYSDGGLFENYFPHMWAATGAKEVVYLLRV